MQTWNISTHLNLTEWTKHERARRQAMCETENNAHALARALLLEPSPPSASSAATASSTAQAKGHALDESMWQAVASNDLVAAKNLYKQGACFDQPVVFKVPTTETVLHPDQFMSAEVRQALNGSGNESVDGIEIKWNEAFGIFEFHTSDPTRAPKATSVSAIDDVEFLPLTVDTSKLAYEHDNFSALT